MAHVLSFRSSKFDIATEMPNPINPIAGQSVLRWLCEQLRDSPYRTTTPEAEDWGWYVDVNGAGGSYLVGASGDPGEPGASIEWTVQIDKHRSMRDKFTGANKMSADDALSALVERILRSEPGIADVERETDS